MSPFGNNAINRIYLQAALRGVAERAGGLFTLVYLLKMGVPAPMVFCSLAAIVMGRYALRPGILPLARRIGLRNVVILGTLIDSLSYLLIPFVDGVGPVLAFFLAVNSLGGVVFWTSYHAYISAQGDAERRGGQVGTLLAVQALVGIFAPALGGVALAGDQSLVAFGGAALVLALSAMPLIGAPDVAIAHDAPTDPDAAKFARRLFFMDGWSAACSGMVWQIALFVTLGERFGAYGGAMALAGIVGALMSVGLGRAIDLGHGLRSIKIAYGMSVIVIVLRALGFGAPVVAVTANALAAVSSSLLGPAYFTPVYNAAKRSACPLRFHIIGESGWDLGCASASLIAAALLWAGVSYAVPLALALVSAGAAYLLLRERWLEEAVQDNSKRAERSAVAPF